MGFFKHLPVAEDVSSRKDFFGEIGCKIGNNWADDKKNIGIAQSQDDLNICTFMLTIYKMSATHVDIELVNAADLEMARRHIIGENEVKRINIKALVEAGAHMLYINQSIKDALDVGIVEKREGKLGDGSIFEYDVVGPIEIRYNSRRCTVNATVLDGGMVPLLRATLKDMPACRMSFTTFELLTKDVLRI